MKNRILFSLVVAVIPFFSFAQIDDMYFVPQKETREQKEQQTRSQPSMHAISESVATTASNEHVQNNARDVDEYNRRYRWENDSTAANEEETANEENARADSIQGLEEDYQYTKRILRFNTPTIGVAVSSPLYWDLRYGPNSIMASLLTEFIMKAERYGKWSQEVRRNINSTSYKTFLDFIALVDANFKTKKEIKWYAGELGISTVLLARYTKMYDCNPQHPQTPLKILNNRIYIEAEHLLRHTNMTIEQISDTLGFNDYSYFIKFYKKINPQKRTPLQCRNSWNTSVCRSSL